MLRSSLRWLKQIITALIVLLVMVCLFEISLRVYDSHTGQITRCELFDQGVLTKSRFCHHELKPLLRINMPSHGGEPDYLLQTNSLGLRGPEIEIPKPNGTYRIICLGDERTAGTDVPEEETFCQQLQQLLQKGSKLKIEVINAGTPDYCPLLSSLQFKQKLMAARADLVLMNWDMSDVWDDYRYRRYTTMGTNNEPLGCSNPLLDPPRLRERRQVADLFLIPEFCVQHGCQMWARRVLPAPPKEIDSPTGKYTWLQDQPPDWSIHIDQALQALVPARDYCEAAGGTFVVAAHPAPWQVDTNASNGENVRSAVGVGQGVIYASRTPFSTIEQFCDEKRMFYCDLSESIEAETLAVDYYQADSANYSLEGHRAAALILARFIVQSLDGPWRGSDSRSSPRNDRSANLISHERN